MFDADPHNFGRRVERIERASGFFFQKPRPIYWEWLFFGKQSPLSAAFNHPASIGLPKLQDYIFNLEVEFTSKAKGCSAEIKESSVSPTDSHTYSLGVLLAYCYIFGIRDLHKGNLVKTDSHLQVIDAEVVLAKLLLPHETLLLPHKEVNFSSCGAGKIFGNPNEIDAHTCEIMMSGFFDLFDCVLKERAKILAVFEKEKNQINNTAVRHILRDTIRYPNWKTQTPKIPFFDSEIEQLSRGDIPYFFKFIGHSSVYAQRTADEDMSSVDIPEVFKKGADREAIDPSHLLSLERVRDYLLPTGTLYLSEKLFPSDFQGSLKFRLNEIDIRSREIRYTLDRRVFTCSKTVRNEPIMPLLDLHHLNSINHRI